MPARLRFLVSLLSVALAFSSSQGAAPPDTERLDLSGDSLPTGAITRLGTIRWRYANGFRQPVLSPDGRWLLSSAPDGLLAWETATGRLVFTLAKGAAGDDWPFKRYAFLPDGKRLLAADGGSGDQPEPSLSLWEFPSFRLVKRWRGPSVDVLVVSPDGRRAASCSAYSITDAADAGAFSVSLIDLSTGGSRLVYRITKGFCKNLAFTSAGGLAILTTDGHHCHFCQIDLLTRTVSRRCKLPAAATEDYFAVLAPDGRHVATQDLAGTIRLWRPQAGSKGRPTSIPSTGNLTAMAFRPDGRGLITVRQPEGICCHDLGRGDLLERIPLARSPRLDLYEDSILVSPAGRMLSLVDAGRHAHQAVWRLAAAPGMEAFLTEKLAPGSRLDAEQINKHTAELAGDFATRQRAERQLAAAADAARPALLRAQRNTVDLEQRLRLERLLARLALRSPEQLRLSRAIIALEGCGSHAARHLLQQLAGQLPRSRLTDEAKAALARLNRQRAEP